MLSNEKIYIGASNSVRDYMSVDDQVNVYMPIIKSAKANGQIYNVGTGASQSGLTSYKKRKIKTQFKKENTVTASKFGY